MRILILDPVFHCVHGGSNTMMQMYYWHSYHCPVHLGWLEYSGSLLLRVYVINKCTLHINTSFVNFWLLILTWVDKKVLLRNNYPLCFEISDCDAQFTNVTTLYRYYSYCWTSNTKKTKTINCCHLSTLCRFAFPSVYLVFATGSYGFIGLWS